MREEHEDFEEGRGFVDQVFTQRMISEKLSEKVKMRYVYFMYFEKKYDRVSRDKLFNVLMKREMRRKLLYGIKGFYENCGSRVKVRKDLTEWFRVGVGLKQGCAMPQ